MFEQSIATLAKKLRNKDISSVELTRLFLARIAKLDPQLNSFITVSEQRALEQAAVADTLLQSGKGTSLTGIPVAHKDLFCTEGTLTTCGSKMLHNFYTAIRIHRHQSHPTSWRGYAWQDQYGRVRHGLFQ